MTRALQLLVVSQHAAPFCELLRQAELPGLSLTPCRDTATALAHCDSADILFGAPDLLVPLLPQCPRLQWVQSSWAGIKPLADAPRRDYQLTGVQEIFGTTMAEYVLAWILGFTRKVIDRSSATHWDDRADRSLNGRSIGIMGTGSIGSVVARLCTALGMQVRGLNTHGNPVDYFQRCYETEAVETFADGLEFLVSVLPDTPATDGIINQRVLAQLAPGAMLINAGRGNAIVYPELLESLASGQLSRAVLDVFPNEPLSADNPLWQVENLYITSHTAAPTHTADIAAVFCDNYRRFYAGEPLKFEIDLDRGY